MRDHIAEYSMIPPAEILAIRDVTRYRRKTVNMISAEKNRMSNCLTVTCIKLDEVLSDTYGKTGQALIGQIIEHGGSHFDPAPYIDKRVKATAEEFEMALDGDVTPATMTKMTLIQQRQGFFEHQKAELEKSMISLSENFCLQQKILMSIPGINTISAISIIAEIGVDMEVFGTVKKFLSWVGIVPQNNESAGKKKSTRIGKGNAWLKPVMIQYVNAAIKDTKHLALKKRRGHGKAIVAIAKRLMTAVFYMLERGELYNHNMGRDVSPKRGKIDTASLIAHYRSKGYTIISEGKAV